MNACTFGNYYRQEEGIHRNIKFASVYGPKRRIADEYELS